MSAVCQQAHTVEIVAMKRVPSVICVLLFAMASSADAGLLDWWKARRATSTTQACETEACAPQCCRPAIPRPCHVNVCRHQRAFCCAKPVCRDTCCLAGSCEPIDCASDCAAPGLCCPTDSCGTDCCDQCQTSPECCTQEGCCQTSGCCNSEEYAELCKLIQQSMTGCYARQRCNAVHHLSD